MSAEDPQEWECWMCGRADSEQWRYVRLIGRLHRICQKCEKDHDLNDITSETPGHRN